MTRPYNVTHYCDCTPRTKTTGGKLRPGKVATHVIRVKLGGYYPGNTNIRVKDGLEEIWLCDDCYKLEQVQEAGRYGCDGDEGRHGWQVRPRA